MGVVSWITEQILDRILFYGVQKEEREESISWSIGYSISLFIHNNII